MKSKLSFLFIVLTLFIHAQTVNIPDANFKAYLVGNTAINTNSDSEIQVSEAAAFTGSINCSSMNISDLTGIEAFTNLIHLECSSNQLTSLDVSNNAALIQLYCGNNQLPNLDVSQNLALTVLSCNTNQLTDLDISNNIALQLLQANNNQFSNLDITQNPALVFVNCQNNQLSDLDISNNLNLTQLHVSNNQFTNLDVSFLPALTNLSCNDNLLISLNAANGNNVNFTWFTAQNNPDLICIQVDDADYSNSNWTGSGFNFDPESSFSENCNVYIPDPNFKASLVGNPQININGDAEIQFGEAAAYTGQILCGNLGISDLTGIEAFVNITDLQAPNNNLTSLDLSSNTALVNLYLFNNQISSIDLSQNTALIQLTLYDNQIPSIDVSNNTALATLLLNNNQLTSIDVSNNPVLYILDLRDNLLNSIDLSNNLVLLQLALSHNQLTSLDLNANTALIGLYCAQNQLTDLDLSNNPALTGLLTEGNQLTDLDLSNNPALTQLACNDNNLSSLNLASGNSGAFIYIAAQNNPNLTCIQVDDADYSTTNWTGSNFNFDSWANFSEDCSLAIDESGQDKIQIYPNPAKSFVNLEGLSPNTFIQIFAFNGKMVHQEIANNSVVIDINDLPSGIYIIRVKSDEKIIDKKLIVKR